MISNYEISQAMSVKLEDIFDELPAIPEFVAGIRRAPKRELALSQKDTELALKNALRYIPEKWHETTCAGIFRGTVDARTHLRLSFPSDRQVIRQAD